MNLNGKQQCPFCGRWLRYGVSYDEFVNWERWMRHVRMCAHRHKGVRFWERKGGRAATKT